MEKVLPMHKLWQSRKLLILGCGPGSPEYITPLVQTLATQAEFLIGSKRCLELFPLAQNICHKPTCKLSVIMETVEAHINSHKRVAWLATGDVNLYSIATTLRKYFGHDNFICVAGVSCLQVACARLNLEMNTIQIYSLHSSFLNSIDDIDLECSFALFLGRKTFYSILSQLVKHLSRTHELWSCSELTYPNERIARAELDWDYWAIQPLTIFIWKRK